MFERAFSFYNIDRNLDYTIFFLTKFNESTHGCINQRNVK